VTPPRAQPADKPAGKTTRARKPTTQPGAATKGSPAIILLRGSALPPSPFELGCTTTRMHVEYDPRNMAGMSAIAYAALSGRQPDELENLICQFTHEGNSYGLQVTPLLLGSALKMPAVKRDGILKATAAAASELARPPEPIHWWLALNFVLHGCIPRAEYVRATLALHATFATLNGVDQRSDVLIWKPYTERKGAELIERLARERKRNPFLASVRLRQVMAWIELDRPLLAGIVMRRVAERFDSAVLDSFNGTVLRLPPGEDIPAPKRKAAEEVLQLFESGAGLPLEKLLERWPKHRVVINQLLEAGQLIQSAEGFVFTERQIVDWLNKLKLRADAPIPGTGDLKKLLGLPRKDAEQLRALLLAKQSGGRDE
jgi:hypothetical protein